jgi:hypothetical protein
VLAYLVAWVIIPGDGRKSSIAENIAGEKHDAWSGWRSPNRLPTHPQAATGEWIEYTAVAESFVPRGPCGLAVVEWDAVFITGHALIIVRKDTGPRSC